VADLDVQRATVGFDLHRGAVACADRLPLPDPSTLIEPPGRRTLLVTERLADLENLGSLFRNARAFGVDGVLLDPETTDPLHRRVVRVSMGHALRVPFARLDPWPGALHALEGAGYEVVALTPGGAPIGAWRAGERVAFLVGAEGPGLTEAALAAATHRLRIPMAPGVDSVNVATAAAIALSARFGEEQPG
jgi:tRNA G18 (ribose-2'-O)-methylase SpoU